MRYLLSFLCLILCCLAPVAAKKKAKLGNIVQVEYTGTVDNGTIFDSNIGQALLEFKLGDQSVLKAFEDGIIGMKVGQSKNINIPADYAYGQVYPNKIIQLGLDQINQETIKLNEGTNLKLEGPDGAVLVRVVSVEDGRVYLDANHLLAGKDLNFEVKLISVNPKKKD